MPNLPLKSFLLLTAGAFMLAGCGGGGSSSSNPPTVVSPPPPPPPPTSKSGVVTGPISGFGSVIVNGERYNTDNASFNIDGQSGTQADLKVGQIVTMKTSTDAAGNKSASSVSFKDLVQGPITEINLKNNRVVVLGQTVIIRGSTSFDEEISPASIDGLAIDDIIQVSGQFNGGGNIVASQIELKDAGENFEITGHVSGLDTGAQTFRIRGQDIDYSGATLEDFNGADISNGNRVEVKGDAITGGAFTALSVSLQEKEKGGDADEDGEIHGVITEFTSAQDFVVGDIPVITNAETAFEKCQASDLGLDVEVEIEGTFDDAGVLVADKVECEIDANIKVETTVDAVDAAAGTITVWGVTFNVDMSTRFQDKTDTPVSNFNFADLMEGDYVDVKGFEREDMSLYAVKIEREDPSEESSVQGLVEIAGTDSLTILGIDIETDAETDYESPDDVELTAEEFFGAVMVDDLVKAKGARTDTDSLLAREIEFETEDD